MTDSRGTVGTEVSRVRSVRLSAPLCRQHDDRSACSAVHIHRSSLYIRLTLLDVQTIINDTRQCRSRLVPCSLTASDLPGAGARVPSAFCARDGSRQSDGRTLRVKTRQDIFEPTRERENERVRRRRCAAVDALSSFYRTGLRTGRVANRPCPDTDRTRLAMIAGRHTLTDCQHHAHSRRTATVLLLAARYLRLPGRRRNSRPKSSEN